MIKNSYVSAIRTKCLNVGLYARDHCDNGAREVRGADTRDRAARDPRLPRRNQLPDVSRALRHAQDAPRAQHRQPRRQLRARSRAVCRFKAAMSPVLSDSTSLTGNSTCIYKINCASDYNVQAICGESDEWSAAAEREYAAAARLHSRQSREPHELHAAALRHRYAVPVQYVVVVSESGSLEPYRNLWNARPFA